MDISANDIYLYFRFDVKLWVVKWNDINITWRLKIISKLEILHNIDDFDHITMKKTHTYTHMLISTYIILIFVQKHFIIIQNKVLDLVLLKNLQI